MVSMVSSVISSIQLPEPSQAGLFNTPRRARRRNYQLLDREYTYVVLFPRRLHCSWALRSKFEFGQNSTALYYFGILLDPLSETAQKYSSIIEVGHSWSLRSDFADCVVLCSGS